MRELDSAEKINSSRWSGGNNSDPQAHDAKVNRKGRGTDEISKNSMGNTIQFFPHILPSSILRPRSLSGFKP